MGGSIAQGGKLEGTVAVAVSACGPGSLLDSSSQSQPQQEPNIKRRVSPPPAEKNVKEVESELCLAGRGGYRSHGHIGCVHREPPTLRPALLPVCHLRKVQLQQIHHYHNCFIISLAYPNFTYLPYSLMSLQSPLYKTLLFTEHLVI